MNRGNMGKISNGIFLFEMMKNIFTIRYNFEFRDSDFGLSSGVYFYTLFAWDPSTSPVNGTNSEQSFIQTKNFY